MGLGVQFYCFKVGGKVGVGEVASELLPVATPRSGQGVPRNTLTWKKKLYIIIKKIYLFTLKKKKKIKNTLNQN